MSMGFGRTMCVAVAMGMTCLGGFAGCDDSSADADAHVPAEAAAPASPDGELRTHEIVASTPTPEGLAYIQAVAAIHRDADGLAQADARIAALQRGLALEVPSGLPEAEILRLELAARIAASWLEQADAASAAQAQALLKPMLAPGRSLPLDRASAEALVLLGDAATRTGDDALAAGTYARSIRMMSILRQELER